MIYDDPHRRQNTSVQPPPYHVPPARQEHILQQLTAIKEVRNDIQINPIHSMSCFRT